LKVALFYFLLFLFHVGDLSTPLEKAQVKIGNLQFFSSPPQTREQLLCRTEL